MRRVSACSIVAASLLVCVSCATGPGEPSRGASTEDFAKVTVNKTTADEVRALLGPPARRLKSRVHQGETWGYRHGGKYEARVFWIEFTPDGVAREVSDTPDFEAGKYRGP